jgi:hypothetical protein
MGPPNHFSTRAGARSLARLAWVASLGVSIEGKHPVVSGNSKLDHPGNRATGVGTETRASYTVTSASAHC